MQQSTGNSNEIPTSARTLSEDDLTFLDDVPEDQVEEFLEWVPKTNASKWFLSNAYTYKGYDRDQWGPVGDYFRYLRTLHE